MAIAATADGQIWFTERNTDQIGRFNPSLGQTVNPAPLTVVTNNSIMLVGNTPPPLTGTVNGTPFTSPFTYTTPQGDQVTVTLGTTATSTSRRGPVPHRRSLSGANSGNYVLNLTAGTMYVVTVGADPSSPRRRRSRSGTTRATRPSLPRPICRR